MSVRPSTYSVTELNLVPPYIGDCCVENIWFIRLFHRRRLKAFILEL